jgi:hypothetical protein
MANNMMTPEQFKDNRALFLRAVMLQIAKKIEASMKIGKLSGSYDLENLIPFEKTYLPFSSLTEEAQKTVWELLDVYVGDKNWDLVKHKYLGDSSRVYLIKIEAT